jgi:hypothetical protein
MAHSYARRSAARTTTSRPPAYAGPVYPRQEPPARPAARRSISARPMIPRGKPAPRRRTRSANLETRNKLESRILQTTENKSWPSVLSLWVSIMGICFVPARAGGHSRESGNRNSNFGLPAFRLDAPSPILYNQRRLWRPHHRPARSERQPVRRVGDFE